MRKGPNHVEHLPDGSALITLTRGRKALVDARDLGFLMPYRWAAHVVRGGRVYAIAHCGGAKRILMHRLLCPVDAGMQVDHRNGSTLDNRRANLRPATHSENCRNTRQRTRNTTGFHGVVWEPQRRKYRAQIRYGGKTYNLGRFASPVDAALVRDAESRKQFGAFAVLNFPDAPPTVQ